jgi:hypothetical protein
MTCLVFALDANKQRLYVCNTDENGYILGSEPKCYCADSAIAGQIISKLARQYPEYNTFGFIHIKEIL